MGFDASGNINRLVSTVGEVREVQDLKLTI